MEPSRQPFRFEDPRQERIYCRLRDLVGHGPAAFFRDACRLMAEPDDLQTTIHLVGHSLREIESALRAVLESVAEREDRLRSAKRCGARHEDGIKAILRGLGFPETDQVAKASLGLSGED